MRTIIFSLFVVVLASAIPAPIDIPSLLNPVSPASPASPVNQANPVNPVDPVKNPVGPKKVVPGTGFMVRAKRFISGKCSTTERICTSTEGKNNWTVECSTKCSEGLCSIDTGRGANVIKPTAKCNIRKSDIM
ncbi:hypothetical protein BDV30DRAFT_232952 [Aspergillus minisclerotigenes]|uniref:Uncharacterized protein n=1 Tax=Aspergillus minisclerotigenes TaxID=656917 RepID=A0A5N6JJI8_9EURO|nr:hypothetical protein BDV30DRAFT_232952 [Aspergillus minisclerotigenes]